MMLQVVLALSCGMLFYIYVGYPLVIYYITRQRGFVKERRDVFPPVTILISARNEEQTIAEKLKNTLLVDYPRELMEVIVISDGSTDRTDQIVQGYSDHGVRLLRLEERRGKTAGINEAMRKLKGDIVVMTDSNAMLERNAIRELVKNFSDPQVGFATGWTQYQVGNNGAMATSAGLYVKYERHLKIMESRLGSCVGFGYQRGRVLQVRIHGNDCITTTVTEPSEKATLVAKVPRKGYVTDVRVPVS